MLDAKNRLKKRKEFAYIYKKGKKIHGQSMSVFFVPSKFNTPRIGFSVSNKVGKAVVRNRIKRQLRHIVREVVPKIHNINMIVLVQPEIVNYNFQQLKDILVKILLKGNIINE